VIRLFSYYGSKCLASGKYPAPLYPTIIEPFAGAAGYSCRYADRNVILFESDPKIAAVLVYLVAASGSEILRLPLLGPNDSVDDLRLPQEARWLIGLWCNSGAAAPRKHLSKWGTSSGLDIPIQFWGPRCRERLAKTVEKIKHWKVHSCSWQEAGRMCREPATWFIDPPYQGMGHFYPQSQVNYKALSLFCRCRPGQTIVCENAGADWLPFTAMYTMRGTASVDKSRKKKKSIEAIWYREQTT
jgi:hypothetical protein